MNGWFKRGTLHGVRISVIAALLIMARYGFSTDSGLVRTFLDSLITLSAVLYALALFLPHRDLNLRRRLVSDPWIAVFTLLSLLALVLVIFTGKGGSAPGAVIIILTIYSALVSFRIILAGLGTWVVRSFNPAAILPVTFGLVILAGSVLLLLPEASNNDISVIDSTFTATSATCVTGLIVRDTGADFTFFGQAVILLMIQIGGLGLMTFVAFFALFLGQNISLRESMSMTRIMDSEFVSDLKKVLASIVGWTLTIEAAGAFILFSTWRQLRPEWPFLHTLWQSVFHSVSSFCNAGFSLNSTNLEGFAGSPATCFTVGTLIVLGGLGFVVLTSIGAVSIHRIRTGRKMNLPVHTRLVLLVTGILIVGTFLFFLVSEWNNSLQGMDFGEKVANSYLEAVTPRTAGFNTVPTSGLLPSVRWLFIVLMFIGASPGGTGGGVKTSTVGLLFVGVISLFRRRRLPEMWKHHIPYFDVQRASVVFLLGIVVFSCSSLLLLMVEGGRTDGGFTVSDYLFEAASAFGTVGLSTGVTGDLSTTGRIIIILTMFLGRTGPASLAAATGRSRPLRYRYPEARITIG